MTKKILIVEDNSKILEALAIRFRGLGLHVYTAGNIIDAMYLLHFHKPDLLLLDVWLPGGSGFEFTDQILEDPNAKNIPIIFMTACQDEDIRKKIEMYQVHDFFQKPFDSKELIGSVMNAL